MNHIIIHATSDDLTIIYKLFEEAILYQKQNHYKGWENYDKEYIKEDIRNGLLFKITRENNIICIFSICYSDSLIWRNKEKGDAIYLHRIVLNREFKGEKIFRKVLDWAIDLAIKNQLKYIRMDTWAHNNKIIDYYKSYGFSFVENYITPDTADLPQQHRALKVALLEFKL